MRILITADLHYDIGRSRAGVEDVARQAVAAGGDALVLVGDTAGADLTVMRQCLALFAGFGGRKFLVPGNHCLWCRDQENSLDRYERILPALAQEEGFSMLDRAPAVLGEGASAVGLAGSIGWYDYAFRQESLGIPDAFYRAKIAPGAAAYYEEYHDLLETHRDSLREEHHQMPLRWMDGVHVRLGMSDEEFVHLLAEKLRRQLRELEAIAGQIVVFMHHLPFAELVPREGPTRVAFAAAFMGSPLLGEALLACPKVSYVYCGHSHWPDDQRIGHLKVINVGSTYKVKRLLTLEL